MGLQGLAETCCACTCACAFPALCLQVHCHDRLKKFLQTVPHHVASTWLGMYGGKSPKCIRLWSSDGFVRLLHRTPVHTGLMLFGQGFMGTDDRCAYRA